MINSSVFTRSQITLQTELLDVSSPRLTQSTSTTTTSFPQPSTKRVQKSTLPHLHHSYIHWLFLDQSKTLKQKRLSCRQLGQQLGSGYAQILSQNMVEKFIYKDSKAVKTQQEMKFMCENLWPDIFGKKADKLHYSQGSGVFTILDHDFRLLRNISSEDSQQQLSFAILNIQLASGIVEGAMSRLGHDVEVKDQEPELKSDGQLKTEAKFEMKCKNAVQPTYFCTY